MSMKLEDLDFGSIFEIEKDGITYRLEKKRYFSPNCKKYIITGDVGEECNLWVMSSDTEIKKVEMSIEKQTENEPLPALID